MRDLTRDRDRVPIGPARKRSSRSPAIPGRDHGEQLGRRPRRPPDAGLFQPCRCSSAVPDGRGERPACAGSKFWVGDGGRDHCWRRPPWRPDRAAPVRPRWRRPSRAPSPSRRDADLVGRRWVQDRLAVWLQGGGAGPGRSHRSATGAWPAASLPAAPEAPRDARGRPACGSGLNSPPLGLEPGARPSPVRLEAQDTALSRR